MAPTKQTTDPGLTAKGEPRQFVQHAYKDRAHEEDGPLSKKDEVVLKQYDEDRIGGPFPLKLHIILKILEKEGKDHIISWLPHGRAFGIHKPGRFEEEVVKRFFKQSQISSFRRQLNLYGFLRLSNGRDSGSYYHELFLRGKPLLAMKMVRTRIKGTKIRASSSPADEPHFYSMPFLGPSVRPAAQSAMQRQMMPFMNGADGMMIRPEQHRNMMGDRGPDLNANPNSFSRLPGPCSSSLDQMNSGNPPGQFGSMMNGHYMDSAMGNSSGNGDPLASRAHENFYRILEQNRRDFVNTNGRSDYYNNNFNSGLPQSMNRMQIQADRGSEFSSMNNMGNAMSCNTMGNTNGSFGMSSFRGNCNPEEREHFMAQNMALTRYFNEFDNMRERNLNTAGSMPTPSSSSYSQQGMQQQFQRTNYPSNGGGGNNMLPQANPVMSRDLMGTSSYSPHANNGPDRRAPQALLYNGRQGFDEGVVASTMMSMGGGAPGEER